MDAYWIIFTFGIFLNNVILNSGAPAMAEGDTLADKGSETHVSQQRAFEDDVDYEYSEEDDSDLRGKIIDSDAAYNNYYKASSVQSTNNGKCVNTISIKGKGVSDNFQFPCSAGTMSSYASNEDVLVANKASVQKYSIYGNKPNSLQVIEDGKCYLKTYTKSSGKITASTTPVTGSACAAMKKEHLQRLQKWDKWTTDKFPPCFPFCNDKNSEAAKPKPSQSSNNEVSPIIGGSTSANLNFNKPVVGSLSSGSSSSSSAEGGGISSSGASTGTSSGKPTLGGTTSTSSSVNEQLTTTNNNNQNSGSVSFSVGKPSASINIGGTLGSGKPGVNFGGNAQFSMPFSDSHGSGSVVSASGKPSVTVNTGGSTTVVKPPLSGNLGGDIALGEGTINFPSLGNDAHNGNYGGSSMTAGSPPNIVMSGSLSSGNPPLSGNGGKPAVGITENIPSLGNILNSGSGGSPLAAGLYPNIVSGSSSSENSPLSGSGGLNKPSVGIFGNVPSLGNVNVNSDSGGGSFVAGTSPVNTMTSGSSSSGKPTSSGNLAGGSSLATSSPGASSTGNIPSLADAIVNSIIGGTYLGTGISSANIPASGTSLSGLPLANTNLRPLPSGSLNGMISTPLNEYSTGKLGLGGTTISSPNNGNINLPSGNIPVSGNAGGILPLTNNHLTGATVSSGTPGMDATMSGGFQRPLLVPNLGGSTNGNVNLFTPSPTGVVSGYHASVGSTSPSGTVSQSVSSPGSSLNSLGFTPPSGWGNFLSQLFLRLSAWFKENYPYLSENKREETVRTLVALRSLV